MNILTRPSSLKTRQNNTNINHRQSLDLAVIGVLISPLTLVPLYFTTRYFTWVTPGASTT